MLKRPPIKKIFLATQSEVKKAALKKVLSAYKNFYPTEDNLIISLDIQPKANPAQPVNSGFRCALNRIQALKYEVQEMGEDIYSPTNLFLSIESAIVSKEGKPIKDVCFVQGHRGNIAYESFSYPIVIPEEWSTKYLNSGLEKHELGFTNTFGEYISNEIEGINGKNWMAHEALGANDRVAQIEDALYSLLGKFMIENRIAYYPDFPKPGVTFKDLSLVIGQPDLLRILVSSLTIINREC